MHAYSCPFPEGCTCGESQRNDLQARLADANGKLHMLQSMMAEAGFPMRIKLGEDLHGNEDWVRVRPEGQMKDVLADLAKWREAGRTLAFCDGVLSVMEISRDFNAEGVKEARRRIAQHV